MIAEARCWVPRLVLAYLMLAILLVGPGYTQNPYLIESVDGKGKRTGLYKKVVVNKGAITSDNPLGFTKLYRDPGGTKGEILDPFSIFFRVKTAPENGRLRVGDKNGRPLGWIKEKNLISWNTRFCLLPMVVLAKDGGGLRIRGKGFDIRWVGPPPPGVEIFFPLVDKPTVEAKPHYSVALFGIPARQGTCQIHGDLGNVLGQPAVMVSEDDLIRLKAHLNLLVIHLKDATNPPDRGNVDAQLKKVKESIVRLVTGQGLDVPVPLEVVMSNLPLTTPTLRLSLENLVAMDADSFARWLESLGQASKRLNVLLDSPRDVWREVSRKAVNHRYTYILVDELP